MKLATFLPPGATQPRAGEVRDREAIAFAGGEVGGFAVADDVSARDLQRREPQWTRAKGADTFCPWGPWITTPDEVPDPENLWLRTWVNGELRQDSNTNDLIF